MTIFNCNSPQTFSKKSLSYAMMLASISSTAVLTACQSVPAQNPTVTSTISSSRLSPSQNAQNLMTDMMIHRFDKAYDFEKITQYHAYPLYADNDIEKNDQSLWFTLLQAYTDKKHKKSISDEEENDEDISVQTQQCQDSYETAMDKLDANSKISRKTYQKKSNKIEDDFEKCLDNLSDDSQAEIEKETAAAITLDKQLAKEEKNPTKNDETNATKETHNPDKDLSTNKYQQMVKTIITKLDTLDQKAAEKKPQDLKDIVENSDSYFVNELKQLKLTPQQIQVLNDSYLAPKVFSYKGSFNPATNQYSTVYEESLHRPFIDNYKRVPVLVDFNEMSITAEPDVLLPFVGVMGLGSAQKPTKLQPNLAELAGKSVKFTLPQKLQQKIPLNLLKDTLMKSIGKSYADLPAERFSDVTLDDYAKSLHASRAVKLNLTHQDIGYLLGRTMKYWAIELNNVTAQHPEYITNRDDFKASLDLLNALNRHYRAEDLAKIAQIVEAVLPLSYNGYNYYYFDSQNNLVGYRKNTAYSSSLFGARMTSTTTSKLNYAVRKDNSHAFYQPKPADIVDGNALLAKIKRAEILKSEAQSARWHYSSEDEFSDKPKEYAKATAEKAARYADIYDAEKLKFNKNINCQKFANKNEEILLPVLKYRYDKDFATEYPTLQKFLDTCPAQVEKLENLRIKREQAKATAEDAARAAKQAADATKDAKDTQK